MAPCCVQKATKDFLFAPTTVAPYARGGVANDGKNGSAIAAPPAPRNHCRLDETIVFEKWVLLLMTDCLSGNKTLRKCRDQRDLAEHAADTSTIAEPLAHLLKSTPIGLGIIQATETEPEHLPG